MSDQAEKELKSSEEDYLLPWLKAADEQPTTKLGEFLKAGKNEDRSGSVRKKVGKG
jgi:hypothetical protein